MNRGWKSLDAPVEMRPDGSLKHKCVKKENVDRVFLEHADGTTYERLQRVEITHGKMYIDYRYTEITDPKWRDRPIYWALDKLA